MDFGQHSVDWKGLFRRRGFSFLFAAMFISLFGTGMNYAAVTWYVLEQTDSTVSVGLMIILLTLPGLVVPPFGGVLIDRVDRRYLGMALDVLRSLVVLSAAGLIFLDIGTLWPVYAMVMVLGAGFAVYWSTMNALVQEFVLPNQLVGANAAVLIAVQTGMMTAGALVGFLYEHLHVTGILAIDGITYLASALCLLALRHGYFAPQHHDVSPTIEAPPAPAPADQPVLPPIVEPGVVMGFLADLREGWHYLRDQPLVRALGLTYACMMAGVISANVVIVVLARDVLDAGPRGFGFLNAGWALGAVVGGIATGALVRHFRPVPLLITALATLAIGHTMFPYVRYLALAVAMHALFGACRAVGGVLTQSSIMTTVPRRLMGRTQSAFSVLSTLLQVVMSFSLGWLAEHVNVPLAFLVLGALYGLATLAAAQARTLLRPAG